MNYQPTTCDACGVYEEDIAGDCPATADGDHVSVPDPRYLIADPPPDYDPVEEW